MNDITIARSQGGCTNTALTEWKTNITSLVKEFSAPVIGNKDGSYFIRCAGTQRNTAHVSDIANILILDGDSRITEDGEIISGAPAPESVHFVLTNLGLTHFIYSSFSNGATEDELKEKGVDSQGVYGADYHKYRVVIPCTYNPEQLPALLDQLFKALHKHKVMLAPVKEDKSWPQPWFFPRVPDEQRKALFKFYQYEGKLLPVEDVYQAWLKKQPPRPPEPTEQSRPAFNEQNGGRRNPIIEFNQMFSVHDILTRNGYLSKGDRYLRPGSSSLNPGVLLCANCEDGRERVYSIANDVLNDGFSHDAFDCYVLLECSGNENKALSWSPEINTHNQQIWQAEQQLNWRVRLDAYVESFNQTHASVVIGGKHRIMRSKPAAAAFNGQGSYEFFSRDELSKVYDNSIIQIGINALDKPKYANHLMAWAKHPKAKTFKGGVVFLPGRETPVDYFNTWQGFTVEPKSNEVLLAPILHHMKAVLCDGHQDLYEYLIKWAAYTFQNPDKQAGSAIVARGEKGSGKSTFGYFLSNVWGNHSLPITSPKHLVGNFNAHLADICFLFADEAFFSGDKQHEGILKGLITERTFMVERKGIDAVLQPNFLKIYMATNNEFAVPASRDERRYCVLDVSSRYLGNSKYFNTLYAACDSKDVQAAFLHKMLNVDLTDWHSGDIPESVGLRAQRYHSMQSHQRWLADSLMAGGFYGTDWPEEMTSQVLFTSYMAWCDAARTTEFRRATQCELGRYLGKLFKKIHIGTTRTRGYYLTSLEGAIGVFEKYEKLSLNELY